MVRGNRNNSLYPRKLKQLPLKHMTHQLKRQLQSELKRPTKVHAPHNGKGCWELQTTLVTLITPKVPRKHKFQFKERSRPRYSIHIFKKDQDARGNCCMSCQPGKSHHHMRFHYGIIYLRETDHMTATWKSGSDLTRLEIRPLYLNGQAPRHWVKIEWITTSNQVKKYNTTSNRQ